MVTIVGSSLLLIFYFTLYAIIHSYLAGAGLKQWFRQKFGSSTDRWYRLAYNIFATITLLPMFVLLKLLPDQTLYIVPTPWRWLMLVGQFVALVSAAASLWQAGALHFMGLTQLIDPKPTSSTSLNLAGFYKWVRHPLYTFSLIFIWLSPLMTSNTLTTFTLFTLYFYIGSIYEERRLMAQFGSTYKHYRRQVPRLIPMPGRHYQTEE